MNTKRDTRTTEEILRERPEAEIDRRPHILARARWVIGEGQRTDTGWISEHDVSRTVLALAADLEAVRAPPESPTVAEALRDERVRAGTHWVEYQDAALGDSIRLRITWVTYARGRVGELEYVDNFSGWRAHGWTHASLSTNDLDAVATIVEARIP